MRRSGNVQREDAPHGWGGREPVEESDGAGQRQGRHEKPLGTGAVLPGAPVSEIHHGEPDHTRPGTQGEARRRPEPVPQSARRPIDLAPARGRGPQPTPRCIHGEGCTVTKERECLGGGPAACHQGGELLAHHFGRLDQSGRGKEEKGQDGPRAAGRGDYHTNSTPTPSTTSPRIQLRSPAAANSLATASACSREEMTIIPTPMLNTRNISSVITFPAS